MKIISWNVNGLRAIAKKNLFEFIKNEKPDVLAFQEIKAKESDLSESLKNIENLKGYFNSAERPGYSGVAIYSNVKEISITKGFGIEKFDIEGRLIQSNFSDYSLLNIYFPNGKMNPQRLKYKLDFYNRTIDYIQELLQKGQNVIVVGDYNTAHKEIDLSRPKENENISGFLKIERVLLDKLEKIGMVDAFRHFNKEPENYTWWSQRTKARERNVGWRIDYAFVNKDFLPKIKSCTHLTNVKGSDHCPLELEVEIAI